MTVAVAGRTRALATPRSGRLLGLTFALMKPINCPPLPALGHSRNRKQPRDFIAIAGVYAKHVSNGENMIWSLDDINLVSGSHIPLRDESEEGSRPQRLGEAARKHFIIHPNSKPPARDSRL